MKRHLRSAFCCSAVLLLSTMLFGCAGRQQSIREETIEPSLQVQKLAKKYSKVAFNNVKTTPQIASDYPDAGLACKISAVTKLGEKRLFEDVSISDSKSLGQGTLVVRTQIEDMRLVGSAARFWVGAMAGSSYMTLKVELVDGETGDVVGKQELSSANNAFGAAWTGGGTDNSLPSDMGGILAEYIASVSK